jgi:hypothetical protein
VKPDEDTGVSSMVTVTTVEVGDVSADEQRMNRFISIDSGRLIQVQWMVNTYNHVWFTRIEFILGLIVFIGIVTSAHTSSNIGLRISFTIFTSACALIFGAVHLTAFDRALMRQLVQTWEWIFLVLTALGTAVGTVWSDASEYWITNMCSINVLFVTGNLVCLSFDGQQEHTRQPAKTISDMIDFSFPVGLSLRVGSCSCFVLSLLHQDCPTPPLGRQQSARLHYRHLAWSDWRGALSLSSCGHECRSHRSRVERSERRDMGRSELSHLTFVAAGWTFHAHHLLYEVRRRIALATSAPSTTTCTATQDATIGRLASNSAARDV